jgi:hypothetical protein
MPTGPKGEKRPADVIGTAVKVMWIARGEETDPLPANDGKDPKTLPAATFFDLSKVMCSHVRARSNARTRGVGKRASIFEAARGSAVMEDRHELVSR